MKINTLSDIFGDRVPGIKKPVTFTGSSVSKVEEEAIEKIKQKEFKTDFFSKEVPGVSMGGRKQFDFFDSENTNKIDEMLKMPKTKIKKPKFGGYDKLFKKTKVSNMDMKAKLLMSKSTNIAKKLVDFGINVPKVKKLKGFKGKVNFYLSSGKGEKKAWALLNRQPEKVALKRIQQQKWLSPMGDFDMDKKINMLDCSPFNPYQQGVAAKLRNWASGRGFTEDVTTPVGRLETYDNGTTPSTKEEGEVKKIDVSDVVGVSPTAQVEYKPVVVTGVKERSPLKKILEFTGIPKKIEEYKEEQKQYKEAKKRGRELGLEYAKAKKVEDVFEEAKRKAAGIPEKKKVEELWRKRYERDVLGLGRRGRRGVRRTRFSPYDNLIESIRTFRTDLGGASGGLGYSSGAAERLTGLRSTGAGIYSSLGLGLERGLPFDVKVDTWFGKGERLKQLTEAPQQQKVQPQVPARPTVTYAPRPAYQPAPRGPPPQPGMVWSERSKRYVRYPRGEYRKRQY